jgi:hypothetical protein
VAPHLLIAASASVATATKRRNKRDYFTTIKTKAPKCLPPCSPCAEHRILDELIELRQGARVIERSK